MSAVSRGRPIYLSIDDQAIISLLAGLPARGSLSLGAHDSGILHELITRKVHYNRHGISMQNRFKRFSIIAGFAALLIVLIGNGFLTRREVDAQIESQSRLADSHRLLLEL